MYILNLWHSNAPSSFLFVLPFRQTPFLPAKAGPADGRWNEKGRSPCHFWTHWGVPGRGVSDVHARKEEKNCGRVVLEVESWGELNSGRSQEVKWDRQETHRDFLLEVVISFVQAAVCCRLLCWEKGLLKGGSFDSPGAERAKLSSESTGPTVRGCWWVLTEMAKDHQPGAPKTMKNKGFHLQKPVF